MKYSRFFVGGAADSWLNTQNCREKLNNLVAPTHLELRSPMFGEFCISFFLGEFQWNWWFRWGIYVKSGLAEIVKNYV